MDVSKVSGLPQIPHTFFKIIYSTVAILWQENSWKIGVKMRDYTNEIAIFVAVSFGV